ncbi:sugar ABC transporter substrate-binding protein [Pseudonocardia pini]|uniref:sugar ABC transporter substrate-binding protein n=1 Tax=Pseudonocardia pini TaxID=2758030 RepID=UPI0015F09713|nr:substrate-binding domain-containing protein [Pseudonocardia pini]
MKRIGRLSTALAAGALLLVAGCAQGGGGGGGSAAQALPDTELISTAQQRVTAATRLDPVFPMPTEGFAAGSGTAAIVVGGFQAPVHAEQAKVMQDAVGALGWQALGPFDGQFSPAVQGGFVDQAVQQKADGILLYAIDVNTIKASIDRALAAGVVVACSMCTSGDDNRAAGVIDVTSDFEAQGEALGWYIVDRTEGRAKVAITVEPASNGVVARTDGLKRVLDQCAGCSYEEITIPAADSTLPGPPQWTAFLSGGGTGFTDAVAYYDGLVAPMTTTLAQTGRKDLVISGYDADPIVVAMLEQRNPALGADVASPIDFASWGAVDMIARTKAGKPGWAVTSLPTALLTTTNVAGYQPPLQPSGDWRAGFEKLWTSP